MEKKGSDNVVDNNNKKREAHIAEVIEREKTNGKTRERETLKEKKCSRIDER